MSEQFFRLDGKVAVVTGGGQGIGEAICRRLALTGHRVATTGSVDAFVGVARRLFGDRLPQVESVEIEPVAPVPVD